jgi:hypothetical protein
MPSPSTVYNSRNPEMPAPSSRVHWCCCVLLLLAQAAHSSDWKSSAKQLADKIAAVTGPGVIAIEVNNRSSLSAAESDVIRRALIAALGDSGVRILDPNQAAGTVHVTLSESLQNYVWVAEIQQGIAEPTVVIVSARRPDSRSISQNSPLTLHATALISQSDPILDVALLEGSPRRLLALSPSQITAYEFKDGRWIAGQSLAIGSPAALPRDLRGRIVLRKDHLFDAYLPGLACRSANSAPLALTCAHSDDPWPLQWADAGGVSAFFAPTRNFFTGALVPGIGRQKSAPAFYSAAMVARENYNLWILAGVDGQLHLMDGINHQALPKIHWGSDIASVHTPCRAGSQVLASSAADDGQDSVQAFEFPDREPVAVSQKLDLNGPVAALRTASDGASATVVIRNSETGNYEASLLNLTCGQ